MQACYPQQLYAKDVGLYTTISTPHVAMLKPVGFMLAQGSPVSCLSGPGRRNPYFRVTRLGVKFLEE